MAALSTLLTTARTSLAASAEQARRLTYSGIAGTLQGAGAGIFGRALIQKYMETPEEYKNLSAMGIILISAAALKGVYYPGYKKTCELLNLSTLENLQHLAVIGVTFSAILLEPIAVAVFSTH